MTLAIAGYMPWLAATPAPLPYVPPEPDAVKVPRPYRQPRKGLAWRRYPAVQVDDVVRGWTIVALLPSDRSGGQRVSARCGNCPVVRTFQISRLRSIGPGCSHRKTRTKTMSATITIHNASGDVDYPLLEQLSETRGIINVDGLAVLANKDASGWQFAGDSTEAERAALLKYEPETSVVVTPPSP
jgi:hypothetical protein